MVAIGCRSDLTVYPMKWVILFRRTIYAQTDAGLDSKQVTALNPFEFWALVSHVLNCH